ncbi:cytochrome C [Candidatus Methylomirabilis lanthanidiphila]|uniref:Cytochrome C n=1 Tax=Candidatus Methylomirabilis lanthanidiphila TaxID=2211376 RepID=A0A564ZGI9_9BACT|nr:c-type cytochrome [Candidatus Methylomirabilis lanthanidiphila]VUZ84007.1 cytochrome C [Candidatus Methylomirabilis lanthanidiphila]
MRTNVLFRLRYWRCMAVLPLLIVGAAPAFGAGDEKAPASAQSTYAERCALCHGVGGKGDGWQAKMVFWMKMPNFTDSAYMQTRSDEALLQILKAGGKTGMPAYGLKLTEPQMKELTVLVRGFSNAPAPQKPASTAAPAPQKPAGGAAPGPQKPTGAKR